MGRSREPRQEGAGSSSGVGARPLRVSAERLFELARHLTERDREVALYLYRHRVLTTDQLQLLFFSSRRRAQDRLLFLYRNRVLDRFYPGLGGRGWCPPAEAADHLNQRRRGRVVPDAGFYLETAAGPIECHLEW